MIAKKTKVLILAIIISSILFIASAAIRIGNFSETKSIQNLDASYHVLLTTEAFDQTPWQVHRFLPLVTLGRDSDKHIPWGPSLPDSQGNHYYTSFGTLGFLAPYLAFKLVGVENSLYNLLKFNLTIGYLSAILLIFLIWRCLEPIVISRFRLLIATIFSAAIYIFSFESLYSHGVIYWHHSLWNLVWIAQLLCFQSLIIKQKNNLTITIIYLVLGLISPMIEWTGFIGNFTLAFLPICVLGNKRRKQFLLKELLIITFVAAITIFIHYSMVIGLKPFLSALKARFIARHFEPQGLSSLGLLRTLINGYVTSFGLTIPIVLISLAFLRKFSVKPWGRQWILFWLTLLASSIVLLENILMLQHAGFYHYDRLKAIIPITLLAVGFVGLASRWLTKLVIVALLVSIAININNFIVGLRERDVSSILRENDRLMLTVNNKVEPCALWALNGPVRGWVNLTLNRGVYEDIYNVEQLIELVEDRSACQGVLLIGFLLPESGIYDFQEAYLYKPDNNQVELISLDQGGIFDEYAPSFLPSR